MNAKGFFTVANRACLSIQLPADTKHRRLEVVFSRTGPFNVRIAGDCTPATRLSWAAGEACTLAKVPMLPVMQAGRWGHPEREPNQHPDVPCPGSQAPSRQAKD